MNRKDQIYKAAFELFNRNGFDKTPTAQIAKEAGVAIGTLFHYFKSKEELINSLYLKCKESMLEKALVGICQDKSYRSKIKHLYVNLLKWGLEYTEEFMFFQQFSNSVHIYDNTRTEGRNKYGVLMNILKEGKEKEILKDLPLDYLLAVTSAILASNINYLIANENLINNDEFIDQSFSVLWDSVKS